MSRKQPVAGLFAAHVSQKPGHRRPSAAVAAQTTAVAAELEKVNAEKIVGPGAVPVTLKVNGQTTEAACWNRA